MGTAPIRVGTASPPVVQRASGDTTCRASSIRSSGIPTRMLRDDWIDWSRIRPRQSRARIHRETALQIPQSRSYRRTYGAFFMARRNVAHEDLNKRVTSRNGYSERQRLLSDAEMSCRAYTPNDARPQSARLPPVEARLRVSRLRGKETPGEIRSRQDSGVW